jgi:adenosine deaminase
MDPRVATLDKAELHCHLDGILDPEMLETLHARGHDFGLAAADLASRYPFDSLEKWGADYYQFLEPFLTPAELRLSAILECHIERLKRQRVTYAEIFVSRLLGTTEDIGELVELFGRLRRRADSCAGADLHVELVVAIGRGKPERLERQGAKIIALYQAGVIAGVALAGDEGACEVASVRPLFERFRATGMGIEIHAGEQRPASSVWDAVLNGFPHRIGHGVSAFTDPRLVETIAARGIHVEFCPTSNLRLRVIESVSELPVRAALAAGIDFSINTDDPGPFSCSVASELQLVAETFGLDEAALRTIGANTRRAGFAGRRAA